MCPKESWTLRHDNNLLSVLALLLERHSPDKEISTKQPQKQARAVAFEIPGGVLWAGGTPFPTMDLPL